MLKGIAKARTNTLVNWKTMAQNMACVKPNISRAKHKQYNIYQGRVNKQEWVMSADTYTVLLRFLAHAPIVEKLHFERQLKMQVCLYYIYFLHV